MRVVYYTHPAFLEPALHITRELGSRVELHLLIEVGPAAWQTAAFDASRRQLDAGLVDADPILQHVFPPSVREYWRPAASVQLVVHDQPRSIHPASFRVGRAVMRFVRQLQPDVVHVDDTDVSLRLALVASGFDDLPVVVSVHDPTPHSGEGNWRKTLSRKLIYRRAARFIVYSESLLQPFAGRYRLSPGLIRAIRLGPYEIYRAWAERRIERDETMVLLFGRLSPYKGLDVMARAAQSVAERIPRLRVIVAGQPVSGYQPPPSANLAQDGRFEVRPGYLANADMAELVRRSAFVICPYLDGSQSGVILTAFGLERTVVASAVGGLPEYVADGRTGLLVPPGDVPALVGALEELLMDPGRLSMLEDGVRAIDGQTMWAEAANRTIEVYRAASS
jgi:glycosyltransferase involved in cell wall biosynthesis